MDNTQYEPSDPYYTIQCQKQYGDLQHLIADMLCIDRESITDQTRLDEDLRLDSLSMLNLFRVLEDQLHFSIDLEELTLADVETVGSFKQYIERCYRNFGVISLLGKNSNGIHILQQNQLFGQLKLIGAS